MKILIDKADGDDQLVEMLKKEISRLKEQCKGLAEQLKAQKVEADRFQNSRVQHVAGNGAQSVQKGRMPMGNDALEVELQRLRRVMEQQVLFLLILVLPLL